MNISKAINGRENSKRWHRIKLLPFLGQNEGSVLEYEFTVVSFVL